MSKKNILFTCSRTGLGDKLLDIIGVYVISKILDYNLYINFNTNVFSYLWGPNNIYDISLFDIDFNNLIYKNNIKIDYVIESPNPSSSTCPFKVYEFLKNLDPKKNISFEELSLKYKLYANQIIKPSNSILSKIPNGMENVYGVHLRKTDKIYPGGGDKNHQCTIEEFNILIEKLLENIKQIVNKEKEPRFLVVSEDKEWKNTIKEKIIKFGNASKKIVFIELNYTNDLNYNSVLDMFCLSKCKTILQGIKHSGFSIIASIIGSNKIINYSKYLDLEACLVNVWSSVIDINGEKIFNIEHHRKNAQNVNSLNIHKK